MNFLNVGKKKTKTLGFNYSIRFHHFENGNFLLDTPCSFHVSKISVSYH
jgi:hypothetical protein